MDHHFPGATTGTVASVCALKFLSNLQVRVPRMKEAIKIMVAVAVMLLLLVYLLFYRYFDRALKQLQWFPSTLPNWVYLLMGAGLVFIALRDAASGTTLFFRTTVKRSEDALLYWLSVFGTAALGVALFYLNLH